MSGPAKIRLSPQVSKVLLASAVRRSLPAQRILHDRGDIADRLTFIESGRVRFFHLRADGSHVGVVEAGPGEWFGDIALLGGLPRPHSAEAVTDVCLAEVPGERLEQLLRDDAEIARAFLRLFAQRLSRGLELIDDMRLLPFPEFVLKQLRHGAVDNRLQIDQQNLADLLGVSRVTLGKVLKKLAEEGHLRTGYRTIELLSEDEP